MQESQLRTYVPNVTSVPTAGAAAPVVRHKPLSVLEKYWGYSQFRFCQEQVINAVLAGNDCLVVMPTGGGKSLCYQVPPLVLDRVCIVVSPLISLMEDQVAVLNARDIPAAFLGSAQSSRQVTDDAWTGRYLFVYVTPELVSNSGPALGALHANRGVALIAIDEAHCVSEWGHDFRPDYRRLGSVRKFLPGVPIVALTATATPRVREDIVRNLGLGARASRFVESFERTNLHFSVRQKGSKADVVAELKAAAARNRGRVPSTLIYALTTREVDEIAANLNQPMVLNGRAGRYHAKMTPKERREAHTAFMWDDLDVLVASVAYGMGIDKPNIRAILHWGCPASVEAYYQQAGRAGRDGANSRCLLFWSPADVTTLARIKEGEGMSSEGRAAVQEAMGNMQGYCSSTGCRHAQLVNFFVSGTLPPEGPCRGGCDVCDRRARGEITIRDIAVEARLLMSAVEGLRNKFGLGRCVQLLRGSRSKGLQPWMMGIVHVVTGDRLHGAGTGRSDSWWKGLGSLLVAEGYLQYHFTGEFQVVRVSEKGSQWLRGSSGPLELELPPALLDEELREHLEAMDRIRQQEERQQALTAENEELDALRQALRDERKRVADSLGHVAPDTLVNDLTLDSLARLRPQELQHLRLVSGMGQAAVEAFGEPLMRVIRTFLTSAQHLGRGIATDWISVSRLRSRSDALAASSAAAAAVAAAVAGGHFGDAGAAADGGEDVDVGGADRQAAQLLLFGGVKGAVAEAGSLWQSGMSAADIATKRPRPIAINTALGYVAECLAIGAAGDPARLALEAGIDQNMAAVISSAIESQASSGIGAVKRFLDSTGHLIEYGQIKVVAALMVSGALWFGRNLRVPKISAIKHPATTNITTATTIKKPTQLHLQQQPHRSSPSQLPSSSPSPYVATAPLISTGQDQVNVRGASACRSGGGFHAPTPSYGPFSPPPYGDEAAATGSCEWIDLRPSQHRQAAVAAGNAAAGGGGSSGSQSSIAMNDSQVTIGSICAAPTMTLTAFSGELGPGRDSGGGRDDGLGGADTGAALARTAAAGRVGRGASQDFAFWPTDAPTLTPPKTSPPRADSIPSVLPAGAAATTAATAAAVKSQNVQSAQQHCGGDVDQPSIITSKKRTLPAIFGRLTKRQTVASVVPATFAAAVPLPPSATEPCTTANVIKMNHDAVLSLIGKHGPLTAVGLAKLLYGSGGGRAETAAARIQLQGILQDLVGGFDIIRKGATALRISRRTTSRRKSPSNRAASP